MVVVLMMEVTIVDVVHMVVMGDGGMAAIRAVYMGMARVGAVSGR